MTIRIKSHKPIRGFKRYLALYECVSPKESPGKNMIETWTYDVPKELTEKAIALGGELLETSPKE